MNRPVRSFPGGKDFAFTIFDDTDSSTMSNVLPIYNFLSEHGFQTTKSVWCLPCSPGADYPGSTLKETDYRHFLGDLKHQGFEIALHNVRNHDSTRAEVLQGLEIFAESFGEFPRTHTNHNFNRENVYWGSARLTVPHHAYLHRLLTTILPTVQYQGHLPDSKYFWGDICKEHINYIRNLVFNEINLDRINPTQPYHDPSKPFANFWFSSSDGACVSSFCRLLSEENQDRLEAEHGVCIVYTHFADGFVQNGRLDPMFSRLMTRLSSKSGWFVPVAVLLDFLKKDRASNDIPRDELYRMERRWLMQKILHGRN